MAEGAHFTARHDGTEPSAGLFFFFFYHLENTSDSFKQQAGKYLNALICLPARCFQK